MTCYNEHNNFRTSKNMEYYIETDYFNVSVDYLIGHETKKIR